MGEGSTEFASQEVTHAQSLQVTPPASVNLPYKLACCHRAPTADRRIRGAVGPSYDGRSPLLPDMLGLSCFESLACQVECFASCCEDTGPRTGSHIA